MRTQNLKEVGAGLAKAGRIAAVMTFMTLHGPIKGENNQSTTPQPCFGAPTASPVARLAKPTAEARTKIVLSHEPAFSEGSEGSTRAQLSFSRVGPGGFLGCVDIAAALCSAKHDVQLRMELLSCSIT